MVYIYTVRVWMFYLKVLSILWPNYGQFVYCKSLIWYFVGISTCMSEKFGTFSEKMVIFTKNLFTEVIEDSCKVFLRIL